MKKSIRIEIILIAFCVVSLLNTPKLYLIYDCYALRVLDWFISDVSNFYKNLVVLIPTVFLFISIDASSWGISTFEKWFDRANRCLFGGYLAVHYYQIIYDYSFNTPEDSIRFDKYAMIAKAALVAILLPLNILILKRLED